MNQSASRFRSFSLRTLMVLVAVCAAMFAWLAHQRSIVRARQVLLSQIQADGRAVVRSAEQMSTSVAGVQKSLSVATVPLVRRWLGDRPMHFINCRQGADPETVAQVRRMFPEALVCAEDGLYQ